MTAKKQKRVTEKEIREIVSKMTLKQKAQFTSGDGMWETGESAKRETRRNRLLATISYYEQ